MPAAKPPAEAVEAMTKVTARWLESVASIEPTQWSSVYGAAAEGCDYLRACEEAMPPSFALSAMGAFMANRLIVGAPVFQTMARQSG